MWTIQEDNNEANESGNIAARIKITRQSKTK